ncbi:hypothetical protein CLOSYM_01926 [[Clostridium] symbiosum ATCC 14940]|uniref:Uncharacterized protein n=1 Tax=[Clostridium] symbiosum ATCC 14940 TaxID=411472 RepID=A0ABC9TZ13_CLOSY|nr:hypothetical protein CLOSYM_01926 [[Clostridium] symbiosum ATCC 14940]
MPLFRKQEVKNVPLQVHRKSPIISISNAKNIDFQAKFFL